jgi:hypothetical protein
MSMRLDIVSNDAGDMVRKEHARDLGAGVVVAIYRLVKLAKMHTLTNQAFVQQLDQTYASIGDYCLRAGTVVNVLFAQRAVFVAGQLLKGSRGVYESATELGEICEWLGGSELVMQRDVTREDLHAFAEQVSACMRGEKGSFRSPTPRIRLRSVADAARLRGLEIEEMTNDQKIVRTYASAVVIMRRFFEELTEGKYIMPRRIKRVAQGLVDLSEGGTAAFLGVTEARNANHDEAGRAVNTAILAVTVAREITTDRVALSQVAMASMMLDVARPRALSSGALEGSAFAAMVTSLSEDQEDQLAAGTAAVLTALGRVNEPSITRTVVAFETQWMRRQRWLGHVYGGVRPPTFHARIIWIARRYNDLLTPEPGLAPPPADYAIGALAQELTDPHDRTVLRMIVSALGLVPMGTIVQLSTGEMAEVIKGAGGPLDKPTVRVVADRNGAAVPHGEEIDLGAPRPGEAPRAIVRVMNIDGWRKSVQFFRPDADADMGGPGPDSQPPPSDSGMRTSEPVQALADDDIPLADDDAPVGQVAPDGERTLFQSSSQIAPVASPTADLEPTARGNLATTPFAHVLVYMLDHELSGTVSFYEPAGAEHLIYFDAGVVAKVHHARAPLPLGVLISRAGLIDANELPRYLESAKSFGLLIGEYLVGEGLITRDALTWAVETQMLERMADLSNLPPETPYSYFRETDVVPGPAGQQRLRGPVNAVLASVRTWSDRARVHATLNRLGRHPLALHPAADPQALLLLPEEEAVVACLRAEAPSLPQLLERGLCDPETASAIAYTLVVTRQLDLKGQKKGPMAPSVPLEAAPGPPSSPQMPVAAPRVASSGARSLAATEPEPPQARVSVPVKPPGVPSRTGIPAIRPIRPAAGGSAPAIRKSGGTIQGIPTAPTVQPAALPRAGAAPVVKKSGGTIQGLVPAPPPSVPGTERSPGPPRPSASTKAAAPVARGPLGKPLGTPRPGVTSANASSPGLRGKVASTSTTGEFDPGMAEAEAALEAMTNFRLAEASLQRGDAAMAEKLAQKAMQGDPHQLDYRALHAYITVVRGGSPDRGLQDIAAVLAEDPNNERALLFRGKIFKSLLRNDEALADFEEVLAINPHHRDAQAEAKSLRK